MEAAPNETEALDLYAKVSRICWGSKRRLPVSTPTISWLSNPSIFTPSSM